MNNSKLISTALIVSAGAMLSACGGGSNGSNGSNDNANATSDVSIRFSDAPVDDVTSVVITVDKIVFNRAGEDIVVDTFTSTELGIDDADTFQIDLLDVRGNENLLVLDLVELPVGEYQNLRIEVVDEDVNASYVDENGGARKLIKVPSGELKLGAFTVGDLSSQTFVIEFGLRQAMTYNPGPERYILKPRGVRIVRLADASSISGQVNLADIHLDAACSAKPDQTIGNVAYLYAGHDLDADLLGDVFVRTDEDVQNPEIDPTVPANIIAPLVATTIDGVTGNYLFSYLNAGDYTVAISCLAADDDPVNYDEIVIPAPSNALIEVSLPVETNVDCDFPNTLGCPVLSPQ